LLRSNRVVSREEAQRLDLNARIAAEADITDRRATGVDFERFTQMDTDLRRYAAAVPWRQAAFGFLGPVEGKVLLDLACGYSMTPVIFALAGASVVALDVAPRTLAIVGRFAAYKGVADRVLTIEAPGEHLPFAEGTFDLIHGSAALHHLQLQRAGPEIARVLRSGGRAAFIDPLGQNPLLEFARDHLPYRNKHPEKATDRPLTLEDVQGFIRYFSQGRYEAFQLASLLAKVARLPTSSPIRRPLYAFDRMCFDRLPGMQRYASRVVTCVVK
jgi:SAM-dependent methyltransferase